MTDQTRRVMEKALAESRITITAGQRKTLTDEDTPVADHRRSWSVQFRGGDKVTITGSDDHLTIDASVIAEVCDAIEAADEQLDAVLAAEAEQQALIEASRAADPHGSFFTAGERDDSQAWSNESAKAAEALQAALIERDRAKAFPLTTVRERPPRLEAVEVIEEFRHDIRHWCHGEIHTNVAGTQWWIVFRNAKLDVHESVFPGEFLVKYPDATYRKFSPYDFARCFEVAE